jgi:hypothetical protein
MPALRAYAGRDDVDELPPETAPSGDEARLRYVEAEVERLRTIVKHQEHALKIAGKVLAPYLGRL